MTSYSKRRLTVLVLALGLIAAAPYVFQFMADRRIHYSVRIAGWLVGAGAYPHEEGFQTFRTLEVRVGPFHSKFDSLPPYASFDWVVNLNRARYGLVWLPDEFITLRVACAVALAGVWGLALGGRLLARRWTRTESD